MAATPQLETTRAARRLVVAPIANSRHKEQDRAVVTRPASAWERYLWSSGVVFVLAILLEIALELGIPLNQNDSAAKITSELNEHSTRLVAVACVSIVYAVAFVIYLWRLHSLLRGVGERPHALAALVLVGGVPFVALHAVSDIGITGLLGAKLASFGAHHDPGVVYALYLMTYALESVGDVFGSLFTVAAGLLVMRSGVLPRWLGWLSILVGVLFFLQGFGLGGVIATFGVVLDLIGFVLFLIFVSVSSIILLRRDDVSATA
jgi:Domain of unknown function (DUF4386)